MNRPMSFLLCLLVLSLSACSPSPAEQATTATGPTAAATKGGPTPVDVQPASPTPSTEGIAASKGRILGIGPAMNSRLVSVAAEEGFRVSDLTQADEVLAGDVAAVVIWLPRLWADPQGADTLKAFLESGGRVLCLYDYDWADQMGSLAELLGVSVIQESVAQSSDSLVYPEEMLPPWLSGLSLGIDGATVELSTYLVASSENGTTRYLVSRDSGEKRLVYYSTPDHSVTFFPKLSRRREESRTPYAFFGDRWFHLHENERGGMAMLQYLVED